MENKLFNLKVKFEHIINFDVDYNVMEENSSDFFLFLEDLSRLFGFSYNKQLSYRDSELDYSEKDWILMVELSLVEREFSSIHNVLQIVEALASEYGWKLDYSVD